jgi:hypothetical protein
MSNDRSCIDDPARDEHTVSSETGSDIHTNKTENSRLCAVLEAMETRMSQTNEYLKHIFEGQQTATKRPRAREPAAEHIDEDEGNLANQPAPKRAKSTPKTGSVSDGNDRVDVNDYLDELDEIEHHELGHPDDVLSVLGGSEFDEIDGEPDNDNLLSSIAQNLSAQEATGPPISDKLAKIINSKLTEDFDTPKLKETLSKYKRPQNCEAMYVPKVNTEIWQKMKPFAKKADIKMANLQDTLLKGLSSLADSTNSPLTCRESKSIPNYKNIIPQLLDTAALMSHVCKELSYKRKEAIRPILHSDFKQLCTKAHKVGPLLFGDDLAKTAQDMRTSTRTVVNLTSHPLGPSTYHRQFTPGPSQSPASRPFFSQRGRNQFPPRKSQHSQKRKTFTKN